MDGTLTLFGFPGKPAHLDVLPRSTAWRASWAAVFGGGGLLMAPLVALVPPHAPWALAALGIGSFMAIRRWRERFTILALHADCPKCAHPLSLGRGTPLRPVMTVPCEGCHHDSRLTVTVPSARASQEPAAVEPKAEGSR